MARPKSRWDMTPSAALGVAVREYPLKADQRADYLLFVSQWGRSWRHRSQTRRDNSQWCPPASSNGIERVCRTTCLTSQDFHSPMHLQVLRLTFAIFAIQTPVRVQVFTFHTPDTLSHQATEPRTLRERLKDDLPLLEKGRLRDCQFEAIINLEASLKEAHPRALIQMATGSGKTYAAVSAVYRLIRFAGIKRVLFLVDRRNLGRQALREFQSYTTPR